VHGSEVTATLMVPLRLMETWAHGQDVHDTLGAKWLEIARVFL
jgi:hypothetical protein